MSLTATIAFADGTLWTFPETAAVNVGTYNGPGYLQDVKRVTLPGVPLTVDFRPDHDGVRKEVVFELGRMWGAANAAAANLNPYLATIADDTGKVLATQNVAEHQWFSRWRWQSSPRPVVKTPTEALAALCLPAPDADLLPHLGKCPQFAYREPMDPAGLPLVMGQVGDHPYIGWLTETGAHWLATGHAEALASLLAQGEGCGSAPWHMRDENTGAPVSVYDHPKVNWTSQQVKGFENVKTAPTGWTLDNAHQPQAWALPYVLTGDLYYLEEGQFCATFAVGQFAGPRVNHGGRAILYDGGGNRAVAWGLRDLGLCAHLTPTTSPACLLPQSYWQQTLADNLWWLQQYATNPAPHCSILRAGPRTDGSQAFMEDYLNISLAMLVRLGFADWLPVATWKGGARIALASGQSGWERRVATPYRYLTQKPDASEFASWQECYTYWLAHPDGSAPPPAQPWPAKPEQVVGSFYWGYGEEACCAAALLASIGVAGAKDVASYLKQCVLDGVAQGLVANGLAARWVFST